MARGLQIAAVLFLLAAGPARSCCVGGWPTMDEAAFNKLRESKRSRIGGFFLAGTILFLVALFAHEARRGE